MTRQHARAERTGVTWFELFYDLVIVAAITSGGAQFVDDPTLPDGTFLAGTFIVAIVVWFSTTINFNLAPGNVAGRRAIVLVQMFAVVLVTLAVGRGDALPDWIGLAGVSFIFLSIAALFAQTHRAYPHVREFTVIAWSALVAGCVVLPAAFFSDSQSFWSGALLLAGTAVLGIALIGHCLPRLHARAEVDAEHLAERVGQLVIIVLGESFLSLVLTLGGLAAIPSPVFFVLAFLTSYAMWVMYFASVTPVSPPQGGGRIRLWLLSAGVFVFGATFSAEALARSAAHPWSALDDHEILAPLPVLYVLLGALALAWLCRDRRVVRVHAAALGALGVLWIANLAVSTLTENWVRLLAFAILIVDAVACGWLARPGFRSVSSPPASPAGSPPSP